MDQAVQHFFGLTAFADGADTPIEVPDIAITDDEPVPAKAGKVKEREPSGAPAG